MTEAQSTPVSGTTRLFCIAYPLLMAVAFLCCAASCLVVRRYPVLRFLFGMSKPRPYAAGERRSPLPATE